MIARYVMALVATIVLITATQFPYDTDEPLSPEEIERNRKYYTEAYQKRGSSPREEQPASDEEVRYVRMAAEAAQRMGIQEQVSNFVTKYGLRNGAVLDIGSGRGYLQDIVENYTGLDVSSNLSRFYHKAFVLGSATAMPFPDNSFDGGWSIWALEHVPNPEQALMEIRRVMKNNAVLFLLPAWDCAGWFAEGYNVRPYSDFNLKGKLIKASIPLRSSALFRAAGVIPSRILRDIASWFGPTRFHYRRLKPNYEHYWEADSDALNGIDYYEMMLWFRTRGDECMNFPGPVFPLIVRIRK